jgi:hypothetical protein
MGESWHAVLTDQSAQHYQWFYIGDIPFNLSSGSLQKYILEIVYTTFYK